MISQMKAFGPVVSRFSLWLIGSIFFGIAMWMLIQDKTASGSAAAGFGIIVLFWTNLDRVESFKGFGLEAKTRDLRSAIVDAERTIERLEALRAEIASLSESVNAVKAQLNETAKLAERAHDLAILNL